jgi:hypothetical protein
MTSTSTLSETAMLIVVTYAINCIYMYFSSPAAYPNVINSTIHDPHLMTSMGHSMLYQDKVMIDMEVVLIPSPLYVYIVHVFDVMGRMTTLIDYQPRRLLLTYKIGV